MHRDVGRGVDVVLRDGSTVRVDVVTPDDEKDLLTLFENLSKASLASRFMTGGASPTVAARWAADVDGNDRYGLVARHGIPPSVVGHAAYVRTGPRQAEVALEVLDAFQGHGIATLLLAQLAEAAEERGIDVFEAEALSSNYRMTEVFRQSGFRPTMRSQAAGVVHVEFPVALTEEGIERYERREQEAATSAVRPFLQPRAVAIVGASRRRGTIGGEIFHNAISAGYPGVVYPVNPQSQVVQSVLAYRSVGDIHSPVDLAVVAVPAAVVNDVARGCADKGVRALVVISAGFAEDGSPEGLERQRELVEICRQSGMRLVGPNCMGLLNAHPDVRLNATFAPRFPPHGNIGFLSQSGGLGLAVIEYADTLGLGISSFISVGNKADLSGNDFLQWWENDPDTDVILLYLESFGNPRRFARIARRVGRSKPIVAVKSGRSAVGARATSSHTGALIASSDVTVDALFRQSGVVRCDTMGEMFNVSALLASQPVPTGDRVAILTNGGGPGILCADACAAEGLRVERLPGDVRGDLTGFLPPSASVGNPVDMIASASAEDYRRAIGVLASSHAVDALVVIFVAPLVTSAQDVAREIQAAAQAMPRAIPLLSVFMSGVQAPAGGRVRVPKFVFPEEAARALAHAVRYGRWRAQPEGRPADFPDARPEEAAGVLSASLAHGPGWLDPEAATRLLRCYGIPVVESRVAASPEEAGTHAAALGSAVALKAVASGLVHKSEAGAVQLSLRGAEEVTEAARRMQKRVAAAGHAVERFLVQPMVGPGVEMLVGVVGDPLFGPVVACGPGGTAVEVLRDVAVRIAPLTDRDAQQMVRSLATFPLLDGYREAPRLDVAALEDIVLRVSALVEAHREIAEMDLNPVMLLPEGAVVVDHRVRVELPPPRRPRFSR